MDSKAKASDFPVALLVQWKEEREQGRIGDVARLRGISDLDLQEMLLQQVEGVLNSIDKLEGVSREVIDEIKSLVERQFVSPSLDTDAIDLLFNAVRSLHQMSFSDDVSLLYRATDNLKHMGLEDQANLLRGAASELKSLQDLDIYAFQQIFRDLDRTADRISEQVRELDRSAQTLQEADEQIIASPPTNHQTGWAADLQRAMPLIAWIFFTGVAAGGILIGLLWAWRSGTL
ncbi:hypothetical protein AB0B28_18800 [Glycomyces sp. NPDC046736]|uniref:hypothetical protein n=1 Tax=Glycomyces sp. NPDC046736 TaxID=3155615 RepID=UPI0033F4A598